MGRDRQAHQRTSIPGVLFWGNRNGLKWLVCLVLRWGGWLVVNYVCAWSYSVWVYRPGVIRALCVGGEPSRVEKLMKRWWSEGFWVILDRRVWIKFQPLLEFFFCFLTLISLGVRLKRVLDHFGVASRIQFERWAFFGHWHARDQQGSVGYLAHALDLNMNWLLVQIMFDFQSDFDHFMIYSKVYGLWLFIYLFICRNKRR